MDTVENKADRVLDLLKYTPSLNKRAVIIGILLEQDRDTRHACAEAVSGCPLDMSTRDLRNTAGRSCMNTKAV